MNETIPLPRPVSSTETTVTLDRADWEAFLDRLDDIADRAAVEAHKAERARLGPAEFDRLCYSDAEVGRMLTGTPALTIWRERVGLTQRALAEVAEVSPSYLAEIESGKKPGSAAALRRLAAALNVPMEHLVA